MSYNTFYLDDKLFYIPSDDVESERYYFQIDTERECLEAPYEFLKKTDVVVQAGGNLGFFPHYYSKKFSRVYTFEPDNRSFQCLVRNVPEDNVVKLQMALGEKTGGWVDIQRHITHIGQTQIAPGKTGIVPVFALDDLNLDACDLIQYDLEGFEYFALLGSLETIQKYSPVLSIEKYGHNHKYGVSNEDLDNLIENRLGYKCVKRVWGDWIYIRD